MIEREEDIMTLIGTSGRYERPVRIVVFTAEGRSRDVTIDVADELPHGGGDEAEAGVEERAARLRLKF